MKRWSILYTVMLACIILALGCSKGGNSPIAPSTGGLTSGQATAAPSQTHLWGYYDCYIDVATKSSTAVLNRNAMFAANVTTFLNSKPANLGLQIYATPQAPDGSYLDVDLDVSLTHPFPGATQYNGYDVRGIFMGNSSAVLKYNPKLKYAAYGSLVQVMYDYDADLGTGDPYTGKTGNPDGYTRWWNPAEFISTGLLGYTQGAAATKNYFASATLNPYKYFADGLSADQNVYEFLTKTEGHGVFSAGMKNSRNYYLRFPMPSPAIKFAYAVVANWKSEKPEDHPANAPEAMALSVDVTPGVFYASPSDNGGNLKLKVSVFDWDSHLSNGVMTDYKLIVESTVLKNNYVATESDMTPIDSGNNYSTFSLNIPADNVTGTEGQQYWVIVEDQNNNYKNQFGVTNLCGDDKLAAFFRNDLTVGSSPSNQIPVVDSGVDGPQSPAPGSTHDYSVTAHDANGDTLSYKWTVTDIVTGVPDPLYNDVAGNSDGTMSIDWSKVTNALAGRKFHIDSTVTDNHSAPVSANTLTATMTTINVPPVVNSGVTGNENPVLGTAEVYEVDASDDNGDAITYTWTVTDHSNGKPIPPYSGVPGNPPGMLSIDWSTNNGFVAGNSYDIACRITDGKSAPVSATTLTATVDTRPVAQFAVLTPMPAVGYETCPVEFQSYSYDLDPNESASLTFYWDFDGDFIYNEDPDDNIDSGTPVNPTHIYTHSWVGTVHLKVVDIHGAESTIASAPVNVTVDTCSYDLPNSHSWSTSQSVSTGSFTDSHIAPMPTRGAATMRIIYPFSTNKFGACNAGGSGGGNGYAFVTSSSANGGGTINRAVITSTDRIIYADSGSNNMLYYCDWSGSAFGTMHNAWPSGSGTPIPNYNGAAPAGQPARMAITDDDKPIILVPYSISGTTTLVMYVWSGAGWGNALLLPAELKTAVGDNWANYSSYLNDMDYDPSTGYVLIVTSYNYHEGIFAISKSGLLKWDETNIWTPANNGTKIGVEVPKVNSGCRIVIFMGGDTSHSTPGMTRCNPLGGVVLDQWQPTGAGSNDIDVGYYACLVPPNGSVTKWRFWGGSGYSSDDSHFVYRDMPTDF